MDLVSNANSVKQNTSGRGSRGFRVRRARRLYRIIPEAASSMVIGELRRRTYRLLWLASPILIWPVRLDSFHYSIVDQRRNTGLD